MSLDTYIIRDLKAQLDQGVVLHIDGSEGRHAIAVKRLKVGDDIHVISGEGHWARARITSINGKSEAELSVLSQGIAAEPHPRVTIVQALPKSERSELAVDLATQAGADRIIPWQAEHCIAQWQGAKKIQRGLEKWRNAAWAATKQARRTRLPIIADLHTSSDIAELIRSHQDGSAQVLLLDGDARTSLKECPLDAQEIIVVIGPEGGISEGERRIFEEAGARTVVLGPEIVRTASAGMVALAAIGMRTDRW